MSRRATARPSDGRRGRRRAAGPSRHGTRDHAAASEASQADADRHDPAGERGPVEDPPEATQHGRRALREARARLWAVTGMVALRALRSGCPGGCPTPPTSRRSCGRPRTRRARGGRTSERGAHAALAVRGADLGRIDAARADDREHLLDRPERALVGQQVEKQRCGRPGCARRASPAGPCRPTRPRFGRRGSASARRGRARLPAPGEDLVVGRDERVVALAERDRLGRARRPGPASGTSVVVASPARRHASIPPSRMCRRVLRVSIEAQQPVAADGLPVEADVVVEARSGRRRRPASGAGRPPSARRSGSAIRAPRRRSRAPCRAGRSRDGGRCTWRPGCGACCRRAGSARRGRCAGRGRRGARRASRCRPAGRGPRRAGSRAGRPRVAAPPVGRLAGLTRADASSRAARRVRSGR